MVLKLTSDTKPVNDPAPVPLSPSLIFLRIVLLELDETGMDVKLPIGVMGEIAVLIVTEIVSVKPTS